MDRPFAVGDGGSDEPERFPCDGLDSARQVGPARIENVRMDEHSSKIGTVQMFPSDLPVQPHPRAPNAESRRRDL